MKTNDTEAYWSSYRAATGVADANYVAVSMGDSPEMADELLDLIVRGPKRATACLERDVTVKGGPMPVVGDYVIVLDSASRPGCIWRTTEVVVKPFVEVDDAFAWDEGEGDRTRDDWLDMHRSYFTRQAAREGFVFDDRTRTVFERFTVVWPLGRP
jgi:uncharacterized protein YhfF